MARERPVADRESPAHLKSPNLTVPLWPRKQLVPAAPRWSLSNHPPRRGTIGKFLGPRLHDRGQHRPYSRSAPGGEGNPARIQGRRLGLPGRERRQGLRSRLRDSRARRSPQVRKLKALLKDAKDLYLATDEDREGEAISWHLCEVLQPKVPVHRLVFHEITEEAIREALEQPRQIDNDLVRAQEVRRIVDRLYGYDVSPLLWRKIRSAALGRPGAKRGRAADRRARAAADGLRPGHLLGPAGHVCHGGGARPSRRRWSPSRGAASPRAAISTPPPAS